MEARNFKTLLQLSLEDAQKAHHQLVEDMRATGQSKEKIDAENENWAVFYACFVEQKMRNLFQCVFSTDETPTVHIRPSDVWDGGPSWYSMLPEVHSKLHVG